MRFNGTKRIASFVMQLGWWCVNAKLDEPSRGQGSRVESLRVTGPR